MVDVVIIEQLKKNKTFKLILKDFFLSNIMFLRELKINKTITEEVHLG